MSTSFTNLRRAAVLKRSIALILFGALCVGIFGGIPRAARAASLSFSPMSGAFNVGGTFSVSIFLDTRGESVNAVRVAMQFPPDKLQVISPTTGHSIITLWATQPNFNNQTGIIDLQGGIPGGLVTSDGLITIVTFRVKAVGSAILKFTSQSQTLANDGKGTDVLQNVTNGVYELKLPPPAGPIVSSETHPDQSRWYSNSTVSLTWAPEQSVEGYSYVLNDEPVDLPDDISEGVRTGTVYRSTGDGAKYFHIKALKDGTWGGTTHFAVHIDTAPPAEFPIDILPGARTSNRQPVIQFASTDVLSGIDHYELKLIPLSRSSEGGVSGEPFFIEAVSPHVLSTLELGTYDVIVRAYDQAGNYREEIMRLRIVKPLFRFVGERGIEFRGYLIPWLWLLLLFLILILILAYLTYRLERWHHAAHLRKLAKELPPELRRKAEELAIYEARRGKKFMAMLLLIGALMWWMRPVIAAELELLPPIITTVAPDISDRDIFYIGGNVDAADTEVVLYLQSLTGRAAAQSVRVTADRKGEWFYRHDSFLPPGDYLLWAQSRIDEQLSPPSPSLRFTVHQTALQFGASRLSYETLAIILAVIFLVIIIGLVIFIAYHFYHGRRKHREVMKEILEAEESVRQGFVVIRRDIEAELALIRQAKLGGSIRKDEEKQEERLLHDLAEIERIIGKEVRDIGEAEK